uniref:Uncharacterized protein n=1 Tax=Schizaphis graminum TaxID=13262 RepID=A0A2S2P412_SCHGA
MFYFFLYGRHEPISRCHAITLTGSYVGIYVSACAQMLCVLDLTYHRSREIFRIKSNRRGRQLTCPVKKGKRDRRSRPNDDRPPPLLIIANMFNVGIVPIYIIITQYTSLPLKILRAWNKTNKKKPSTLKLTLILSHNKELYTGVDRHRHTRASSTETIQ